MKADPWRRGWEGKRTEPRVRGAVPPPPPPAAAAAARDEVGGRRAANAEDEDELGRDEAEFAEESRPGYIFSCRSPS